MLGWRDGQGVGPRRAPKRSEGATNGDGDDYAARMGFTFAPKDVSIANLKPKDDLYGIGYTALDASVLFFTKRAAQLTRRNRNTLVEGEQDLLVLAWVSLNMKMKVFMVWMI